ncbi:pre-mRNA-splicing factor 38-like [Telopea speciosissima]|uniref:pre-mRNA-splicing factor 38-like n=1 Tax=Telopea speciosissima TaxID=54955 RepID=UPI001CC5354D|nr:pre-mRNA-splicing factor 38-like [Telopea speciosissima]
MDEHGNPVHNTVLPHLPDPMAAMLEMFRNFTADQKTLVEEFRAEQRAATEAQKVVADAIIARVQRLEEQRVPLDRDSNVPIEEDRYQLHSVVQRLPDRDGDPRDDYRDHRDRYRVHKDEPRDLRDDYRVHRDEPRDRFRDDRVNRDHYRDYRDRTRGTREPSWEYRDRHKGYRDRDREDWDRNRGDQPTFEEYMRCYFTREDKERYRKHKGQQVILNPLNLPSKMRKRQTMRINQKGTDYENKVLPVPQKEFE